MPEISNILKKLEGTEEAEILKETEQAFELIAEKQSEWYKASEFYCPEGCGSCCHNFEPDLMESEALYFAAWLLENQPETAALVSEGNFPFDNGKTCPFHDFNNPYHCTVYGGRPFICRLFGASCALNKRGEKVWKPCKFIPTETMKKYNEALEHREFSGEEAEKILKKLPPVMSELMGQAEFFTPDNEKTVLLHEVLPDIIKKLLWIISMNEGKKE